MKISGLKIKQRRKRLGLSQAALAKAVSVGSDVEVSNWENLRRPVPTKYNEAIAAALKCAVVDLEAGDKDAINIDEVSPMVSAPCEAPVISFAQAAGYDPTVEPIECYVKNCAEETMLVSEFKPGMFALKVEGDSMAPLLHNGAKVLVKGGEYPQRGDIVVAKIRETGQVVIKEYHRKDNVVRLESLNAENGCRFEWNCKETPGYCLWMYPVLKAEIDLRAFRWEKSRLNIQGQG